MLVFSLQNPTAVDPTNELLIFILSVIPAYGAALKAKDKDGYFRVSAIILLFVGLGYAIAFIALGFPLLYQVGINWGPIYIQIGIQLIITIIAVFGLTIRYPTSNA